MIIFILILPVLSGVAMNILAMWSRSTVLPNQEYNTLDPTKNLNILCTELTRENIHGHEVMRISSVTQLLLKVIHQLDTQKWQ